MSWAAIGIFFVLMVAQLISVSLGVTILYIPTLVLVLFWIVPFPVAWMTRRHSPHSAGEKMFVFSPEGVRITTPTSQSSLDWAAIVRFAEDRRFFIFFASAEAANFIPKRVLKAGDDAKLRAMFLERSGSSSTKIAALQAATASPVAVNVRFELDPAEASRVVMVASRKVGLVWVAYAVILTSLLLTVPKAYAQWRNGGWSAVSISDLVWGLGPLSILFGIPLITRWVARRTLRTGPSARGTQEIGLADWGVRLAGPMYTGEFKWSAFMKAVETEEFFLLFISKMHTIFIPKRLLIHSDTARVRTLIGAGLGTKADLLRSEA